MLYTPFNSLKQVWGISHLSQTVTFSVDTKYKDRIQEIFTFEQLGLSVEMNKRKKRIR